MFRVLDGPLRFAMIAWLLTIGRFHVQACQVLPEEELRPSQAGIVASIPSSTVREAT